MRKRGWAESVVALIRSGNKSASPMEVVRLREFKIREKLEDKSSN